MSIQPTGGNYISNAEFLAWMQEKTDGIYGKMRGAMDTSNDRAGAEDALNDIKAKIDDVKAGRADGNEVYAMIHQAMDKYGTEFPEIGEALNPIARKLEADGATLPTTYDLNAPRDYSTQNAPSAPPQQFVTMGSGQRTQSGAVPAPATTGSTPPKAPALSAPPSTPKKVTIDEKTAEAWSKSITDKVEYLSKQDQLGLINIQEFNAQLNQAKQTASALMDAADKAANAIINHIS